MLKKIFLIRRPAWAWLLYALWVEINLVLVLWNWLDWELWIIQETNLLRPAPTPDNFWWIGQINYMVLCLGIGFALIHLRRYGVLSGLCIAFLALVVLSDLGIF